MNEATKPFLKDIYAAVLAANYTKVPETDADYYYHLSDGTLWILFEESAGGVDWKHNFQFARKPYRDMEDKWYAHRGFLSVWKSVEPHLAEVIKDPAVTEIIIAGYSHGAALALLCHEYCKFNRPDLGDKIEGFGFGCPRVVWGTPSEAVQKRFEGFTVIRNKGDIVTHVPPFFIGYRHEGEMLKIGELGKYNPIDAHRPENYMAELEVLQ